MSSWSKSFKIRFEKIAAELRNENESSKSDQPILNLAPTKTRRPVLPELALRDSRASSAPPTSRRPKLKDIPFPSRAAPSNHAQEVEMKYQEIIKESGVLHIGDMKMKSEIKEIQYLSDLGRGSCGKVVKMLHTPSRAEFAVKQMRKSCNMEEAKRIITDLDVVLKSHDCPYIVECFGYFVTQEEVWICMELMSTCMEKLLNKIQCPIPEKILGKMTVATVCALNYLKESHGVIHRDVKPSNILLDQKGTFKLCDFGISGRLVDSKANTRSAGCVGYMAPERVDPSKSDYDVRADVWSLGVSLVELATGEFPYKSCKTDFEVLAKVINDPPPTLPHDRIFSSDFRLLVEACLTSDVRRRPKYKEILELPFIKRYQSTPVDVAAWYGGIAGIPSEASTPQN